MNSMNDTGTSNDGCCRGARHRHRHGRDVEEFERKLNERAAGRESSPAPGTS